MEAKRRPGARPAANPSASTNRRDSALFTRPTTTSHSQDADARQPTEDTQTQREETPSTIWPPAPKELEERRGTKRRRGGRVKKCFFKGKLLVQRLKEGAAGPKAGAPRQRKLLIMLGITHSTAWGPRQGSRPGGTQSNRQWPSQVGAATIWLLLNATQKYLVVTRRSAFPSEVKQFSLLLVLFLSRENLPMVQRWQRIQKMFSVLCDPNETL